MNKPTVGWVWLGLTKDQKLVITQTNNEDNTLMQGISDVICTPIIGLDLWEHAYFDQYEGSKADYLNTFWNFINWDVVSKNFEDYVLKGQVAPII